MHTGSSSQARHGEYCVTRSDDIMLVHAQGPWNVECVEAFVTDYRHTAAELYGHKWADLIDLEGESLFTPEAESRLRLGIESARQAGLSHVAMVLNRSSVKASSQMQSERLYANSGIHYRFFTDYQLAFEWLQEQGFSSNPQQDAWHRQTVGE